MKSSLFRTVLLSFSLIGFATNACYAQSSNKVDKINDYWNNLDKNYPNLRKTQTVGDLQKAGEIQKAGDIQIPRGIKAITQKKADCSQRFTVGADTLFEFDKATLTPFAMETLSVLKPMIVKLGAHPIKVEGHTDGKGTDLYNQPLSERRAERVKNWLLENHVCPASGLATEGFGRQRPVARNNNPDGSDNPQGRALNRRVEIIVDTCKNLSDVSSSNSSSSIPNSGTATTTAGASKTAAAGLGEAGGSVDNSVWLPYSNVMSSDEITKDFTRLKVTPLNSNQLYFEILVPNNWDSKKLEIPVEVAKDDSHNQVPLAQIEPNNGGAAVVEVRYMRVPEDVSLTRFVRNYADTTGFQLVTRQKGDFNSREVEDVLLKKQTEKNGIELTRLTAARRGELVLFVASSCPEKDYDKWKRTFATAAITFDPCGK